MNENPSLSDALHTDSQARQSIRMVGGEPASQVERRPCGSTTIADRGDAIREIAANLERLCIEYSCQGRVSPLGVETRAIWVEFKSQIEELKAIA